MKFYDNEKKVRFLTVVDGQPVFAHRGQNGVLKNISPAITGVRVMSDGRIRVTLSESDTKEGSVYDATGVVTPNKTNFWGVASDIAVNIDGNIAKITGNFTCWTVETHRAHQEWLTTPDGMEWAEERRRDDEAWAELRQREVAEFTANLKAAEKIWDRQQYRWVRRYISSNGKKAKAEALAVLWYVPCWVNWRSMYHDEDLPGALREILNED